MAALFGFVNEGKTPLTIALNFSFQNGINPASMAQKRKTYLNLLFNCTLLFLVKIFF